MQIVSWKHKWRSYPYILGRGLDLSYSLGLDQRVTKKLALVAWRIWSFHVVVLERAARIYNARAQNIYCFAH